MEDRFIKFPCFKLDRAKLKTVENTLIAEPFDRNLIIYYIKTEVLHPKFGADDEKNVQNSCFRPIWGQKDDFSLRKVTKSWLIIIMIIICYE